MRSSIATICRFCGSTALVWDYTLRPGPGAPPYHLAQVGVVMHLGCEECSETVASNVTLDDFLAAARAATRGEFDAAVTEQIIKMRKEQT